MNYIVKDLMKNFNSVQPTSCYFEESTDGGAARGILSQLPGSITQSQSYGSLHHLGFILANLCREVTLELTYEETG
jgi:hypothetical protein